MHNLIKSRSVLEIIEKPLPQLMLFYGNVDTSKQRENESESTLEAEAAAERAAEVGPAAVESTGVVGAAAAAAAAEAAANEETPVTEAAKLNVNARVFVPRSKNSLPDKGCDDLQLGVPNSNFHSLDVVHKPIQPKLVLPWKGFPKPLRPNRVKKTHVKSLELNAAVTGEKAKCSNLSLTFKKHPGVKIVGQDEKREQERRVALEAIKLVEQRRLRERVGQPQTLVHLTRSPVEFTPEERQRVNRLRIIKREHIERVLREMREDLPLKPVKHQCTGPRYICLQPYPHLNSYQQQPQPEELPQKPERQEQQQQPEASVQPKRFIPTVKQWDERCKALAAASANKENNWVDMRPAKLEETGATGQRAMASSSQDNIMTMPTDNATTAITSSTTSSTTADSIQSKPLSNDTRELFVPRYWPPAPIDTKVESRRGNITHARNIRAAFPNFGLLPTPATSPERQTFNPEYDLPPPGANSIRRYNIEELLQLEPHPDQLEKPTIPESLSKLYFC